MKEVSILKAKALKSGDTVGLISPASSISEKQYEDSLNHLQRLGLTVITGTNTLKEHGHLGGLDHQRLEDLHAMFANPEIDGIWCARGGYGCTRLLPDIDFDLIRRNPKPIIGFSDITALLNAIYIKTGLIGFHGPLGISKVTDFSKKGLEATIFGGVSPYKISLLVQDESVYTIREGSRKGQFVGGNLSLLAAMTGTPHQPDYREKLVFIEEIAEKPYQIDRMLTQLLNGTNLQEAHLWRTNWTHRQPTDNTRWRNGRTDG